jgi:hypothetical protein
MQVCNCCAFLSTIHKENTSTSVCSTFVCSTSVCSTSVCSSSVCSTSVCSSSVCSTSVCHTSVCSTSVCSFSVCSTSVCSTSVCSTSVCSTFRDIIVSFQKLVLQITWSHKYLINHCLFLDAKSSYALVSPASTAVKRSSSWLGSICFRPRLIVYTSWRERSYLITRTSTTRRYNILFFFLCVSFRP